ncbi:MAG: hypothetical protein ACJ77E_00595 [Gaiellaceae bacterium]
MDGVDTFLRRYPDSPVVLDVLGTLDADGIRARARRIAPDTEEIFFFGASVGAVFARDTRTSAARRSRTRSAPSRAQRGSTSRAYAARCHHAYGGDARETGLEELASTLLVSNSP